MPAAVSRRTFAMRASHLVFLRRLTAVMGSCGLGLARPKLSRALGQWLVEDGLVLRTVGAECERAKGWLEACAALKCCICAAVPASRRRRARVLLPLPDSAGVRRIRTDGREALEGWTTTDHGLVDASNYRAGLRSIGANRRVGLRPAVRDAK